MSLDVFVQIDGYDVGATTPILLGDGWYKFNVYVLVDDGVVVHKDGRAKKEDLADAMTRKAKEVIKDIDAGAVS